MIRATVLATFGCPTSRHITSRGASLLLAPNIMADLDPGSPSVGGHETTPLLLGGTKRHQKPAVSRYWLAVAGLIAATLSVAVSCCWLWTVAGQAEVCCRCFLLYSPEQGTVCRCPANTLAAPLPNGRPQLRHIRGTIPLQRSRRLLGDAVCCRTARGS